VPYARRSIRCDAISIPCWTPRNAIVSIMRLLGRSHRLAREDEGVAGQVARVGGTASVLRHAAARDDVVDRAPMGRPAKAHLRVKAPRQTGVSRRRHHLGAVVLRQTIRRPDDVRHRRPPD